MIMSAFCAQYVFWTSLVGRNLQIAEMISSTLACLATYSFDRLASTDDDITSKYRLRNSNATAKVMFGVQCVVFLCASAFAPRMLINTAIAIPFGWVYTRTSIPKHLFFASKNVYVTVMWTAWFFGACKAFPLQNKREVWVVALYMMHMFVSNVIQDVKDVEQDRAQNVPTVPAWLGHDLTRGALIAYVLCMGILGATLSIDVSLAYITLAIFIYVIDLRSGDYATLCTVALMTLPMIICECRQGRWMAPAGCLFVTFLASRTAHSRQDDAKEA